MVEHATRVDDDVVHVALRIPAAHSREEAEQAVE